MQQGVTLLWALRSPCNLGCRYCYFGVFEEQSPKRTVPTSPGQLSHVGRDDLSLHDVQTFLATVTRQHVHRVFVAGGEPLLWKGTLPVLASLKQKGCEVIVCTNGLPLQRPAMCETLLDLSIDAVSISLDSYDAAYHDLWRRDKSGQGWQGVVRGIQTLVQRRNARDLPTKIGVYAVISQQNIDHIVETGRFVAGLGVDYFIVQPISLAPDHDLYETLSLNWHHRSRWAEQIHQLGQLPLGIQLAHPGYLQQVITTLSPHPLPTTQGCFGGKDLFFVEPDGSVWDCPSMEKMARTPPEHRRTIKGAAAEDLFSPERRGRNTDCVLLSLDCVNMWQLMRFDDILTHRR